MKQIAPGPGVGVSFKRETLG